MITNIGFIGLGQMGRWMSLNLLKAGFHVTVYHYKPEKARLLTDEGAASAGSPAELATTADAVFLSLPNTEVVENVIFGPSGIVEGARPGMIVVDLGTTSYTGTLRIARQLDRYGVRFADAPVSGMEARAREGTLTIVVGSEGALFEQLRPILEVIGSTIVHMGPVGSGQLAKLINQLLFNTTMASIAEILPLAVKLGLEPRKVLEVATTGTGRSFGLEFFGPRIIEGRFDQGYPIGQAYKDMISAAEICAQQRIPLPMVQAATTTFQMALLEGYGDEDKGALIKVFERLLGVRFRDRGIEQ